MRLDNEARVYLTSGDETEMDVDNNQSLFSL